MRNTDLGNGYRAVLLGYKPECWAEIFSGNRFVAVTRRATCDSEALEFAGTINTDMSGIVANGLGVKRQAHAKMEAADAAGPT